MVDWIGIAAVIAACSTAAGVKWKHDSDMFDRLNARIEKLEHDVENERRDCERRIDELLERFRALESRRAHVFTPPPHGSEVALAAESREVLALVVDSDSEDKTG